MQKSMVEQQQEQQQQQQQLPQERQRRRRKPLWKRWRVVIPLLVLFVVIVVLGVDLALKPEPGVIDHNWLFLEELHRSNSTGAKLPTNSSSSSSINMTLRTVLLLSNPNLSSKFRYFDARVYMLWSGTLVGQAPIAPGNLERQSSRNVSAVVQAVYSEAETDDDDSLLTLQANITGYVSKWNLFKHHYHLVSACEVKVLNESLSYSCLNNSF